MSATLAAAALLHRCGLGRGGRCGLGRYLRSNWPNRCRPRAAIMDRHRGDHLRSGGAVRKRGIHSRTGRLGAARRRRHRNGGSHRKRRGYGRLRTAEATAAVSIIANAIIVASAATAIVANAIIIAMLARRGLDVNGGRTDRVHPRGWQWRSDHGGRGTRTDRFLTKARAEVPRHGRHDRRSFYPRGATHRRSSETRRTGIMNRVVIRTAGTERAGWSRVPERG